MIKPSILVTSAAGHTGMPVVFQLLNLGYKVRAFVRQKDARSDAIEKAGAEIFIGDLFDMRDLRRSLIGIQRAYYCPPFRNNILNCSALFAIAAEEAKLETVTLLSGWNPHAYHPSICSREHWVANHIYRWMPSVDVINVNPGLFAFPYMLGMPFIIHFGMFVAPFGEGKNAPPSNEDIAQVVVETLVNPSRHIGKCYRPTGPKMMSPSDIAAVFSKVLDRKVIYKDAPFKMFTKAALAQGFSLMDISQVKYYAEELKNGVFEMGGVTSHVEEVVGRLPEKFEDTATRYFQNPSLVHHQLKQGTKRQAIWLMSKMMLTRTPNLIAWEHSHGHPLLKNPKLAHENDDWKKSAKQQLLNLCEEALPKSVEKEPSLTGISKNSDADVQEMIAAN